MGRLKLATPVYAIILWEFWILAGAKLAEPIQSTIALFVGNTGGDEPELPFKFQYMWLLWARSECACVFMMWVSAWEACSECWWKEKKIAMKEANLLFISPHSVGQSSPPAVMHCKSDWLVRYWEIVHLNRLHSPKWWNYCTLVFDSIIAHQVSVWSSRSNKKTCRSL